ncbi:MAG: hypothetical protein ACYC1M_13590 [Armatimonadota bacterium]
MKYFVILAAFVSASTAFAQVLPIPETPSLFHIQTESWVPEDPWLVTEAPEALIRGWLTEARLNPDGLNAGPMKKQTPAISLWSGEGSWTKRLMPHLQQSIKLSGRQSFNYHISSISGDGTSYNETSYYGQGQKAFNDFSELSIQGTKVFDVLNFNMRLSNTPFGNPQDHKFSINYDRKWLKLDLGDINASLQGNELASMTKSLSGAQLTTTFGMKGMKLVALYSQTRGTVRTVTIYGTDSAGPYYLNASQIIDGTEQIRVDGVSKSRGVDYEIDTYAGMLTFKEGIIIPRTSVIEASYESQGYNDGEGTLQGYRMESQLNKDLTLGYMQLDQTQKNSGTLLTKVDQFYGYNNPLAPYELQYAVQTGTAITALVDGIPQIRGYKRGEGDFFLDDTNSYRIYFNRAVPSTSLIKITYIPRVDSSAAGSGSVTGYDANYTLGRWGKVSYAFANSTSTKSGLPVTGAGQSIKMETEVGKLHWTGSLKDVDDNFTPVESVGFQRQERGMRNEINYTDKNYGFRYLDERYKVPSYYSSLTTDTSTTSSAYDPETVTQQADATWQLPKGPMMRMGWKSITNSGASSGNSKQDSSSIGMSKSMKAVNLSLDFVNTKASGDNIYTIGTTGEKYTAESQILKTNISWTESQRFSMSSVMSIGRQKNNGTSGNIADGSINAKYTPTDRISLGYQYSLRDSGSLSSLTDTSSSGGSVIGGGTGFGYSTVGVKTEGHTLNATWSLNDRMSLDANLFTSYSAGDNLTNTDMRGYDLGMAFRPVDWADMSLRYLTQDVRYVGSTDNATNNVVQGTLRMGPFGKLSLSLDGQHMITNNQFTDTTTGGSYLGDPHQVLDGYSARLDYPFREKMNLYTQYRNSRLTGSYGSSDVEFSTGYQYNFARFFTLTIGYKLTDRKNNDPESAKYNYRAGTMDFDISARF